VQRLLCDQEQQPAQHASWGHTANQLPAATLHTTHYSRGVVVDRRVHLAPTSSAPSPGPHVTWLQHTITLYAVVSCE
jgi:hypothetical protein